MWSASCLKLKYGWNHSYYSVYIVKIVAIVFTACLLTYTWSSHYRSINTQPPSVQLYPVIQFDRSGFTKAEILDSSKEAIRVLAKRGQSEDLEDEDDAEDSDSPFNFKKYVLKIEDRKTQRQLLALEALGINGEEGLDVLSGLSNKIPNTGVSNDTSRRFSADSYRNASEIVERRIPDYKKLCIDSTFSVGNRHRVVDPSFCSRLMALGRAIEEGREAPLLTVFTWWLDPVSDGEVLSRKAMINNWNGFRPFVVPVVFTNHRMNMAHANGNGWPCFPATEVNPDGLPVFGALSRVIEKKFDSTFYGYVRQISMFDASLLETLMTVKERYVQQTALNKSRRENGRVSPKPIVISGRSVKMPHFAPDAFIHFERLYEYLRANPLRGGGNLSVESSNYLFYRGVDFTNMPPLVVHDDFLFQYAVDFSAKQGHAVVDASRTLLALRTYRNDNNNEWGRRYLRGKEPDLSYNRRMATAWDRKTQQQQQQQQRQQQQQQKRKALQRSQLKSFFVTRFDRSNNACFLEAMATAGKEQK